MLPRKRRTLLRLHQPTRRVPIHIIRGSDPNITRALLHNNAEDDAFLDTQLGGLDDGVVDTADIFTAVACFQHFGLVEVEDGVKVFPGLLAGEGGGRA